MSSQIFINAHCVFWWLNAFILYISTRRRAGVNMLCVCKYCLDFTRHNSMFISIIFLACFCLFIRSFACSFVPLSRFFCIYICNVVYFGIPLVFSLLLSSNVVVPPSNSCNKRKKEKCREREREQEQKIPKSFYVTFIDFKCKTSNLSLWKFEHKPLIFSFFYSVYHLSIHISM